MTRIYHLYENINLSHIYLRLRWLDCIDTQDDNVAILSAMVLDGPSRSAYFTWSYISVFGKIIEDEVCGDS